MQGRCFRYFTGGVAAATMRSQSIGLPGRRGMVSQVPFLLRMNQKELLQSEKAVLSNLTDILSSLDADASQLRLLRDAKNKLDDIFLLVVIGEFNSGKSTFVNSLLGRKILKEGMVRINMYVIHFWILMLMLISHADVQEYCQPLIKSAYCGTMTSTRQLL